MTGNKSCINVTESKHGYSMYNHAFSSIQNQFVDKRVNNIPQRVQIQHTISKSGIIIQ